MFGSSGSLRDGPKSRLKGCILRRSQNCAFFYAKEHKVITEFGIYIYIYISISLCMDIDIYLSYFCKFFICGIYIYIYIQMCVCIYENVYIYIYNKM